MLYSKSKKTNKTIAQVLLAIILLQYLGILAMASFDLARIAIGAFSLATIITIVGVGWALAAVTQNKLGS